MKKSPFKLLQKLRNQSSKIIELEEKTRNLENLLTEEKNKRVRLDNYTRQLAKRVWRIEKERSTDYFSRLDPLQYSHELKAWYLQKTGKILDLDHPKTYNEKIQWFKLYGITPEISLLSDKLAVRDYVASKIGEKYLIPLIGSWNYPEDIDFGSLPDRFVLKANHGSGYNYLVYDKSLLNVNEIMDTANQWLRQDFAFLNGFELQYHSIPRRLLIEEYLENSDGDLHDYKFRCFNGKVELISFVSDRYNEMKMNWFNRDWNSLCITLDGHQRSENSIPRPDNLDEMIEKAETLAAGFPQVRVDLYRMNDGHIYFGEMTFTPSSGVAKWNPLELDMQLGQLFTYPGMPK